MPKNTWTPEQIATLRALVDTTPPAELARKLGVSRTAVHKKVRKLGLSGRGPATKTAWTAEQLATLRALVDTTPRAELARELGVTLTAVNKMAGKLGLSGRGPAPKGTWTDEETDTLRALVDTTPRKELGLKLGRGLAEVNRKVAALGLGRRVPRTVWTEEKCDLLRRLAPTTPLAELSRRLGLCPKVVKLRLDRLGLERPPSGQKWTAWTAEQLAVLHAEVDTTPREELAEKLGKTLTAVRKQISILGLGDPRRGKAGYRGRVMTAEVDYSADETEFMFAMHEFIVRTGRKFPAWSEVLGVVRSLGYEQTKARATRSA